MQKVVTFPELRGLMAKYGTSVEKLANVAGCKVGTIYRRLKGNNDFKLLEMVRIKEYYDGLGSTLDVSAIFFDWLLTKESK